MSPKVCQGCLYEKDTVQPRTWQYDDSLLTQCANLCDECAALCIYCGYEECICEGESNE